MGGVRMVPRRLPLLAPCVTTAGIERTPARDSPDPNSGPGLDTLTAQEIETLL